MISNRLLSAFKNRVQPLIKASYFSPSSSKQISHISLYRTYSNVTERKKFNFRTIAASIFGSGSLLAIGFFGAKDKNGLKLKGDDSSVMKVKKEAPELPCEEAIITLAPNVPPPLKRNYPVNFS
jgi:hypothetical protein